MTATKRAYQMQSARRLQRHTLTLTDVLGFGSTGKLPSIILSAQTEEGKTLTLIRHKTRFERIQAVMNKPITCLLLRDKKSDTGRMVMTGAFSLIDTEKATPHINEAEIDRTINNLLSATC